MTQEQVPRSKKKAALASGLRNFKPEKIASG